MIGHRLALALLPFALVGCVADDNSGPPGVDSGTLAPTDAGHFDVTLLDSALPPYDANVSDTAVVDSNLPDTGPPPVTVAVVNDLGPESGVVVVFHDATGAVLSTATTDATGKVVAPLVADGQVSVLLGPLDTPQIITVQGVQPGDVLTARDTSAEAALFGGASVQIDGVPASPPAGTESYTVGAGDCQNSFTAPPVTLGLNVDCQAGGKFPLLVEAVGGADAGFATLGFASQGGNVLDDAGTAQLPADGGWSTTIGSATIGVTHESANGFSVLAFSEVVGGVPRTSTNNIGSAPAGDDGGLRSVAFAQHTGYGDFIQSEVSNNVYVSPYSSVTAIATRGAAALTPYDFANALPLIGTPGIDTSDAGAAGRPSVTWTITSGTLGTVDGVLVLLHWSGQNDAGTSYSGSWTIVAPPTATSVLAPSLPATGTGAGWAPPADATFQSPPNVVIVDATFITSYAQLRQSFAALPPTSSLLQGGSGAYVPPLPVDGTLRLTATTVAGD